MRNMQRNTYGQLNEEQEKDKRRGNIKIQWPEGDSQHCMNKGETYAQTR